MVQLYWCKCVRFDSGPRHGLFWLTSTWFSSAHIGIIQCVQPRRKPGRERGAGTTFVAYRCVNCRWQNESLALINERRETLGLCPRSLRDTVTRSENPADTTLLLMSYMDMWYTVGLYFSLKCVFYCAVWLQRYTRMYSKCSLVILFLDLCDVTPDL
jgi:hypothetical protein